ncbi:VOC family protein [Jannaschia sp. S6380]|uniref:VOC family protein n=1 Tax=Jannaschia sp. S6380 TaxID=2926408 RepID=UPI001FF449A9|nr:VOC family protein [Jannaschia sp. S6380]MCK0166048.1 VOC family protein [Jannaschia sp. S6380]
MEKVEGIGGVFIRARDPDALGAWYERHLGIAAEHGHWSQAGGTTIFAAFPETSDYFDADRRWMINFRVPDLDRMIAQLEGAGIAVTTDPDWNSDVGRFARIHDPEGNPVELWQPSQLVRDHEVKG